MADVHLHETDRPAGAPLVPPVDAAAVETDRRQTHLSYEAFLRQRLERLDRERPSHWQRDDLEGISEGIRAVLRGFHVLAVHHPSGDGSAAGAPTGLPDFAYRGPNYGKNRLHRLAIMGDGTLFGLDRVGSSRGLDLLLSRPGVDAGRIGMFGVQVRPGAGTLRAARDSRAHRVHRPRRRSCLGHSARL